MDVAEHQSAGPPGVRVDLEEQLSAAEFGGGWSAYPCGVVAGFQRLGWEIPGFEARISATLPTGGGLSSSAALEVGFATAVEGKRYAKRLWRV